MGSIATFAVLLTTIAAACAAPTDGSGGIPGEAGGDSPTLWFDRLPPDVQANVLWFADHEEDDLSDWEDDGTDTYYAGGGIFCTPDDGEADADQRGPAIRTDVVHSGRRAVAAWIAGAVRAENGNRAVRLMRWTDAAWNEDGDYFPADAYYSVWVYLPERYDPRKFPPWDPGDGGWWNVFQFKSDNDAGSQPVAVVNLWWNDQTNAMEFYLDTKDYPDPTSDNHTNTNWAQADPVPVPVGRWFHLEAHFVKGTSDDGGITVWQDGTEILKATAITTELSEQTAWGIGNYTDHIQPVDAGGSPIGETGSATVLFDDAAVALVPLHPWRD